MRTVNRVVLNSVSLYINMTATLFVTLLGTRFVLQAMGNVEYGAYILVANLVAMFSFLNVAMSVSTQRFISYAIGENNIEKIKEVFYNNVIIHIVIAVVLVILMFTLGLYIINNLLDIPANLMQDVKVVLLCMIAGMVFMVLSVPYEGAMNAHEDIVVIAGINIVESFVKLFSSICLLFISDNKMIVYSFLIMLSSMLAFYLKRTYSSKKYEETVFVWHRVKDYKLIKDIIKFASWNIVGASSSLAKYQGVAFLLNRFFGLVTNAAYGLSQQMNGFLLFFANSAVRPMRPQIVKSEAAGMHKQMVAFAYTTTKFTFLLLCMLVIPIYINLPFVLELWLVNIPQDTIVFCRGFLVLTLVGQLSIGYQLGLESCARINKLQIIVGLMHLLPLIAGYFFYRAGYSPVAIMWCLLVEEIFCFFARMIIARIDADMSISQFVKTLLIPCILSVSASLFITIFIAESQLLVEQGRVVRFITTFFVNAISISLLGYHISMTVAERESIKGVIKSFEKKIRRLGSSRKDKYNN